MGEGRAHSDLLSVRAMTLLSPSSTVVDVGASSGWRAAAIEKAAGATVIAVEPSADAIQCGRWWREGTTLDGIRQEKLYY
jgi:protein-L-isoaspartate O-methyltransferase